MNRWTKILALFFLAGAVLASTGCTLRYDFTECHSESDCVRIDQPAEGEFYRCVENQCVLEEQRECRSDSNCAGDERCESGVCQLSNPPADAGDADGSGDADAADTSCEVTADCIADFGESFYCAPWGECVDTAHPSCDPVYYPVDERDDVILLGSIIPTEGAAYAGVGTTIRNGVRMAVIEYASSAFSLPGGQTIAHLQCQGGSSETAEDAAQHMKDIGVPIVVGPLTSSTFLAVAREMATDDEPMGAIAIGATSPAIANLDGAGKHAFQIIAPDRFQTSAVVDRAQILRRRSCARQGNPECTDNDSCEAAFGPGFVFDDAEPDAPCLDNDPQVAVFYKDDQYGRDFQSLLIGRFSDRYADATVRYYQYANPADLSFDPPRIRQEFGQVVSEALGGEDALPEADIVLFVGTGEAVELAKAYISALPNPQAALSKRYIFSHGAAADSPNMFAGEQGLSEALMGNVESVTPDIFNDSYYPKWQQRYSVTFSAPAQTSVGGLAYDGAYMALFAMAGVPAGEPIDGANVTEVISQGRLQNKDAGNDIILEDNTSFPGEARSALRDGEDIDMVGVSGELDFVIEGDTNKGTIRSNYLGLNIRSRETANGATVYEAVPTRIYGLVPGENYGVWQEIPRQAD